MEIIYRFGFAVGWGHRYDLHLGNADDDIVALRFIGGMSIAVAGSSSEDALDYFGELKHR